MPRIAGPAFTVPTAKHDNLMVHAAIYLGQHGDVIVVEAGDDEMAVASGNVFAIAQRAPFRRHGRRRGPLCDPDRRRGRGRLLGGGEPQGAAESVAG